MTHTTVSNSNVVARLKKDVTSLLNKPTNGLMNGVNAVAD